MNREEFFGKFNGLEAEVSELNSQLRLRQSELEVLNERVARKSYVQDVLRGLEATPGMKDPGKSRAAYYFAREIVENNVYTSKEPSLEIKCVVCGEEKPVIVVYEQTEDSPDGDLWEKTAFTLCEKDGAYDVKNFSRSGRF